MRDTLKRRSFVIGAVVAIVVAGAAVAGGVAVANNGDDEPLTGAVRDRAVAAALAFTGGGTVYEVEIRLEDGSQVEVRLDESFTVLGSEPDDDDDDD